jgi:hypothetical protein
MQKIPLHNGGFALVDDEDFEELICHKWHLSLGYPALTLYENPRRTKHLRMHAMIAGQPPTGKVVDHKNGNKLDNRRENLRFVSRSLNNRNRQKPTGVQWHPTAGKWMVSFHYHYKTLYFGLFEDEAEARSIAALLRGALIYHELTKGD